MGACGRTRMGAHEYMYIYIYVRRLYVCVHACLDLCIYVCAIVCVCSHACMYTLACDYARMPRNKSARSCVVNDCWP